MSAPRDAVAVGGTVGVLEEARVDAGVTLSRRNRSWTHSPSMTGRTTSSAASNISRRRGRYGCRAARTLRRALARGVAGAGAEATGGPVDLHRAGPHGQDAVGNTEPRFSWPWKPTWASSPSSATTARHPVRDLLEDHGAGGVDHVHALAAGVGHDPRLAGEHLGRLGVGHHQEADRLQPDLAWPGRSAGWRCRPRCSAWPPGRSRRRGRVTALMSSSVPRPGSISAAILARVAVSTAALIRTRSSVLEKP